MSLKMPKESELQNNISWKNQGTKKFKMSKFDTAET